MKTTYRYVGSYVQGQFAQRTKKKKMGQQIFPAVLTIYVDLIDMYNAEGNCTECNQFVAECERAESCDCCEHKLRTSYQYNEKHTYVFKPAEMLPKDLRISSSEKIEGNMSLDSRKAAWSVLIEGDFVLKHYEKWTWQECNWPYESYENILAGLFFFCPGILWRAISAEAEMKKLDLYVARAIRKCLNMYILLDELGAGQTEICFRAEEAARKINSSHIIDELADVVLDKGDAHFAPADRIEHIAEVARDGIQFIEERLSKKAMPWRQAIRIFGWRNYQYLRKQKSVWYGGNSG